MTVVHSGFDGLKLTVQAFIPPDLRERLIAAKEEAQRNGWDTPERIGGVDFAVRRSGGSAFSIHTGEYGAEWYLLDPMNRRGSNPGVTVDFRAFLLATGGLPAARQMFEDHMAALGIRYVEPQIRVSRVDFAIDILAPWFEPDRDALVVPQGTRIIEHCEPLATETHAVGATVSGLRAGAVANRQLAIYNKRAEVLVKKKAGWAEIWNRNLMAMSLPTLDLAVRDKSQVWRFELRLGSKQLRQRWNILDWHDLETRIGDALKSFCERVRYCEPAQDSNRARWRLHPLWQTVRDTVANDLSGQNCGTEPASVRDANRAEHKRMLDSMILGMMISRAAADQVEMDQFEAFLAAHVRELKELSRGHPVPLDERLGKAVARYRLR